MFIKKFLFASLIFLITFFLPSPTYAQTLFEDNFESGEITDKWIIFSGTWSRENFSDSNWARVSSGAASDNEIQSGNNTWEDYLFNLDIFKIEGEDINLFFRTQNTRYLNLPGHNLPVSYGLHFKHERIALQKFTSTNGSELQVITDSVPFLNSTLKHVSIRLEGNNIKVYLDNSSIPIINYTDNDSAYMNGGIALGSITGSSSQNVRFDNIVVSQLPEETPSPLPTSTATPSATPIALNVPSLKQYSQPWKNKMYAFTKKTIQEFGCALTSSSMVLQYYGHNITPDELNTWLKNQPDGYIRNGLINWLAVSRYTKLHDTANSPSLEYKRLAGTNENLTNELNNNRPSILKVPGHFVVAKSILPTTFGINDPGYSNRDDLSHYGNSFLAINSYIPSHTDLSYMMFVVNPLYNINLFDSNNNVVPSEVYIEEPINNLLNPSQKSGESLKILIYPKPEKENYVLKISGPKGKYLLDSYLYDSDGKVTKDNFEGKLNGNDTDKFTINFKGRKRINEKERKSHFRFWFKDKFDFFKYFKQH